MHPNFYIFLLQLYSVGGATLGPHDPIVSAGEEEEYKVESILRHCWRGEQWNTYCTGMVIMKQRIVGCQSKISSMLSRF